MRTPISAFAYTVYQSRPTWRALVTYTDRTRAFDQCERLSREYRDDEFLVKRETAR